MAAGGVHQAHQLAGLAWRCWLVLDIPSIHGSPLSTAASRQHARRAFAGQAAGDTVDGTRQHGAAGLGAGCGGAACAVQGGTGRGVGGQGGKWLGAELQAQLHEVQVARL